MRSNSFHEKHASSDPLVYVLIKTPLWTARCLLSYPQDNSLRTHHQRKYSSLCNPLASWSTPSSCNKKHKSSYNKDKRGDICLSGVAKSPKFKAQWPTTNYQYVTKKLRLHNNCRPTLVKSIANEKCVVNLFTGGHFLQEPCNPGTHLGTEVHLFFVFIWEIKSLA